MTKCNNGNFPSSPYNNYYNKMLILKYKLAILLKIWKIKILICHRQMNVRKRYDTSPNKFSQKGVVDVSNMQAAGQIWLVIGPELSRRWRGTGPCRPRPGPPQPRPPCQPQ